MWLTLCTLNIFETFVIICWLLIEINFFKNSYRNTIRVSNLCADPGNFVRGGPGQSDKRALTSFFLVLSFFYSSQMINFKEIYHFSRLQEWSNIFQGGPTISRGGGSNCLFPIETHITCDFPGGSGPTIPPLWIRTWNGLYPDQNWHSVGTELGPNYLQMLSADKVRE